MNKILGSQITPGMTIDVDGRVYRVESCVKVTAKATPFLKTKLRDMITDNMVEKNFKTTQTVIEVFLQEHNLEFLYLEKASFLFLDINTLDKVLVPKEVLGEKISYLKEGIAVKATLYGDSIFSVELPQFLELMVIKVEKGEEAVAVSGTTKKATLETGANIDVPLFIESGDVIKVDTFTNEYIQRV